MAPTNVRMVQRIRPTAPVPLAEAALNSLADAVVCVDWAGRMTYANIAAERLTGRPRAYLQGRALGDVVQSDSAVGAGTLFRPDGQTVPVDVAAAPILGVDGNTVGTVVTVRDVSAALEASRQLAYRAHHDALTGLPNRALLQERLAAAMTQADATGTSVAVCFLDVDGLKSINDVFGHTAGDVVLTTTAARLAAAVSATDTVSRYGGDEFVVVLGGLTDPGGARRTSAGLAHAVSAPHDLGSHSVRVAASLGLALYPDHGVTAEALIVAADAAMYAAKRAGSGFCEAGDDVALQAGAILRKTPSAFVARGRRATLAAAAPRERAV